MISAATTIAICYGATLLGVGGLAFAVLRQLSVWSRRAREEDKP